MKINRILLTLSLLSTPFVYADEPTLTPTYTLEQCRQMALDASHNSELRQEALAAAKLNQQAALTAMFPKVSLNASYTWNSKSPVLLTNEMRFDFGTARVGADGMGSFEWSETSWVNQLNQDTRSLPEVNARVQELSNEGGQMIADAYQELYRAFNPDLTHVVIGQVGITQPIYVGGRLKAMYDIAAITRNVAEIEANSKQQDLIVSVDQAYWRVVNVEHKKQLAEQYYSLLCKLENDVKEALEEGVVTQSDLLKVTTKRGEAEVKKLQAENGLALSKMALCQLIGIPLYSNFNLVDTELQDIQLHDTLSICDDMLNGRSEVQLLDAAEKMAKANVRVMAAGLQPNVVAQANYIYSNPSAENGISNQWKGTGFFNAGVVVNIPIVHADDILRLKAAKHEANIAAIKRDEEKELLTLQTTQAYQKLTEAQQKIVLARLTQNNATEVLRMAQESYDAGMITASELMQAQTAWLAAATDLVDAEAEAKTTETQLRKYLGIL